MLHKLCCRSFIRMLPNKFITQHEREQNVIRLKKMVARSCLPYGQSPLKSNTIFPAAGLLQTAGKSFLAFSLSHPYWLLMFQKATPVIFFWCCGSIAPAVGYAGSKHLFGNKIYHKIVDPVNGVDCFSGYSEMRLVIRK